MCNAWAPHTASDNDVVGFDASFVGDYCLDRSINYFEVEYFCVGKYFGVSGFNGTLAHQGSCLQRVDDRDAWGIEAAKQNLFVNKWNELFDFCRGEQFGIDAPSFCRGHTAVELFHALWCACYFDTTACSVHAHVDVLLL